MRRYVLFVLLAVCVACQNPEARGQNTLPPPDAALERLSAEAKSAGEGSAAEDKPSFFAQALRWAVLRSPAMRGYLAHLTYLGEGTEKDAGKARAMASEALPAVRQAAAKGD